MEVSDRKHRAGALIIKEKKLLLVTNDEKDFYWMPGGRVEPGETVLEALRREVKEELGVEVTEAVPYRDTVHNEVEAHYFLVGYNGRIRTGHEVAGIYWYSREDYDKRLMNVSSWLIELIYPELIEDGLV